jgi:hypothetical protein
MFSPWAFLAPVLALPMEPQRAKYYADLIEKRDPIADLVAVATGIFVEIVSEGIGDTALSDAINATAASFDPAGPKVPWVRKSQFYPSNTKVTNRYLQENSDNCQLSFHTQGGVCNPFSQLAIRGAL